jgi:hypothetical protein
MTEEAITLCQITVMLFAAAIYAGIRSCERRIDKIEARLQKAAEAGKHV